MSSSRADRGRDALAPAVEIRPAVRRELVRRGGRARGAAAGAESAPRERADLGRRPAAIEARIGAHRARHELRLAAGEGVGAHTVEHERDCTGGSG